MKKICLTTVFVTVAITMALCQNLTQTVRGSILDEDSKMPLIGANVIVVGSSPVVGTTTDDNGNFKVEAIPIGRIALKLSYIGYENAIIPNIVVNSGKEVVLNLSMQESAVKMDAVVITLGLNFKAFMGGGKKIIPLLRDAQGKVAVDPANNRYWDYKKAYENDIEDVYQITVSASYKWNKRKTTHELFLNIDNITNTKGRISEFYDADKPDGVGYLTQFGAFPNLMYRVYF